MGNFAVPTANSQPSGITAGPDGNLWFTEYGGHKIGRITIAGVITEYPARSGSFLYQITAGPDGNLWFTDIYLNRIGRITPSGSLLESQAKQPDRYPWGITSGPDGNIWFTENRANAIAVRRIG